MRFEYLVKAADVKAPTTAAIQDTLNALGKEEWELVTLQTLGINDWPTFIFKRAQRPAGT